MPPAKTSTSPRLLGIDALRGLAALSVVIFHAREINWIGASKLWAKHHWTWNPDVLLGYLTTPFYFGGSAVILFFVISGYCIHRPHAGRLSRDTGYRIDPGDYTVRRLWRIYPVLIGALALTYLLDSYTRPLLTTDAYKAGRASWPLFWMNLAGLQGTVARPFGSNVPLWTLAIELQFYLLYPLIFWVRRRWGPWIAFWTASLPSLITVGWWWWFQYEESFFLIYWAVWMVGFLLAEMETGGIRSPSRPQLAAGLAALVPAAWIYATREPVAASLFFALFWAVVIWWSISPAGNRFWSRPAGRFFAWVGVFSYSLYVVHNPLLLFIRTVFFGGRKTETIFVPLALTAVCIGVGWAFFMLVERWSLSVPFRRRDKPLPGVAANA